MHIGSAKGQLPASQAGHFKPCSPYNSKVQCPPSTAAMSRLAQVVKGPMTNINEARVSSPASLAGRAFTSHSDLRL